MKTPCVLVDIDGTIADLTHRLHFISEGQNDWKAFYAAAGSDAPIEPVIKIVRALWKDLETVILVSGRSEEIKDLTRMWLRNYGVKYNELHMRKEGDYRPDHVVKKEILDSLRARDYAPYLAIDDRPSVISLWESEGIKTLAVKSHQTLG